MITQRAYNIIFGMPPAALLPEMLITSCIVACVASIAAYKIKRVNLLGLLFPALACQLCVIAFSIYYGNFVINNLIFTLPAFLFQLFGGYLALKILGKI